MAQSEGTKTRPELNFAPVPEPEPPAKSGTGNGTRLCHPSPVRNLVLSPELVEELDSVTGTGTVVRACEMVVWPKFSHFSSLDKCNESKFQVLSPIHLGN